MVIGHQGLLKRFVKNVGLVDTKAQENILPFPQLSLEELLTESDLTFAKNFFSPQPGRTLMCYSCTSTNQRSCRKWQQVEECSKMMLSPFCVEMEYYKHRWVSGKLQKERTFEMRCGRSDYGCPHHCDVETMMGAMSCHVSCTVTWGEG